MALWGNTDDANNAPKYLSDADKQNAYFVDIQEAAVASNRAKGLKTGGWNLYEEYGNGRVRVESLVPMAVANTDAGLDEGGAANTVNEDNVVADN
jgi:hypothetical protein